MLQNSLTRFFEVEVVLEAFRGVSDSTLMWAFGILVTIAAFFEFWRSISMSEITPEDT